MSTEHHSSDAAHDSAHNVSIAATPASLPDQSSVLLPASSIPALQRGPSMLGRMFGHAPGSDRPARNFELFVRL